MRTGQISQSVAMLWKLWNIMQILTRVSSTYESGQGKMSIKQTKLHDTLVGIGQAMLQ